MGFRFRKRDPKGLNVSISKNGIRLSKTVQNSSKTITHNYGTTFFGRDEGLVVRQHVNLGNGLTHVSQKKVFSPMGSSFGTDTAIMAPIAWKLRLLEMAIFWLAPAVAFFLSVLAGNAVRVLGAPMWLVYLTGFLVYAPGCLATSFRRNKYEKEGYNLYHFDHATFGNILGVPYLALQWFVFMILAFMTLASMLGVL